MLSLETRNLWPPVIDHVSVDKGYEKALGAALGDDLDAPVDASAPMHWSKVASDASDPALPKGAEPLARFVKAPAQLARRLAQIGVVDRETGSQACGNAQVRPAAGLARRRSVALGRIRRGRACPDRGGAAARAAQPLCRDRRRIADAHAPRSTASAARSMPRKRRFDAASHTEAETRARERDLNRQAARLSALAEARARLTASRDEASAAKAEAERAWWRWRPPPKSKASSPPCATT